MRLTKPERNQIYFVDGLTRRAVEMQSHFIDVSNAVRTSTNPFSSFCLQLSQIKKRLKTMSICSSDTSRCSYELQLLHRGLIAPKKGKICSVKLNLIEYGGSSCSVQTVIH